MIMKNTSLPYVNFKMYQCQLYLLMFCATSPLDISWQHLNHPSLQVLSVF